MKPILEWLTGGGSWRRPLDCEPGASGFLRMIPGMRRDLAARFRSSEPRLEQMLGMFVREGLVSRLGWAVCIGLLGDGRANDRLLVFMREDATRIPAAVALAMLGEPAAVPVLIGALGHEHPDVRFAAALALGDAGAPAGPALPMLLRMRHHDPDKGVAERCLVAVGRIEAALRHAPVELEATPAPAGRGTEPEAAMPPAGRGTEPEAALPPAGRGIEP